MSYFDEAVMHALAVPAIERAAINPTCMPLTNFPSQFQLLPMWLNRLPDVYSDTANLCLMHHADVDASGRCALARVQKCRNARSMRNSPEEQRRIG